MGILLKIILISFLIIYLLRTFGRFIIRGLLWVVGRQLMKTIEKQQSEAQKRAQSTPSGPEGEITVTKKRAPGKKEISDNEGEYVPFEEV